MWDERVAGVHCSKALFAPAERQTQDGRVTQAFVSAVPVPVRLNDETYSVLTVVQFGGVGCSDTLHTVANGVCFG